MLAIQMAVVSYAMTLTAFDQIGQFGLGDRLDSPSRPSNRARLKYGTQLLPYYCKMPQICPKIHDSALKA